MLDTVRKYVEAGREALTPKKAEEMARALTKEGQARRDQVTSLARDLFEWSRQNSERLLDTIRTEVKRQLTRAGVATKDDIESLKQRIRKLEAARSATTNRAAAPRKSPGRTTARRQSSTRRSV